MKEIDFIIVGLGIAGLALCEQLEKNKDSFVVFDSGIQSATSVSGGVFNPVVLKRFTIAWMAKEQFAESIRFYNDLSQKLGVTILNETPILRILSNVEEQNDWVIASDKNDLSPFLSSVLVVNTNPHINAPFGFGKVLNTGRIFPSLVLSAYKEYLISKNSFYNEYFEYNELTARHGRIFYKGFSAKKIIFAEGAAAQLNPFFLKHLLVPNKGEFILIRSPKLQLNLMLKGPVYIIPIGDDMYKVGATYSRNDITFDITESAKIEIIEKLKKMILCDFEVIDQETGIRPTTIDRRPLLGSLPSSPDMFYLNGLGTHGIMGAPFLSKILYDHIKSGTELPSEMDIRRWL